MLNWLHQARANPERKITMTKVVGSGGRHRTVAICEFSCWHGSYAQALKCKNALAKVQAAVGAQ